MIKKLINKYLTFIKYIISASLSFTLDLALFHLFIEIFKDIVTIYIYIATILARIISSFFNYTLNKNTVFKYGSKAVDNNTLIKYYSLVIVQMLVSATLVSILFNIFEIKEMFIKIPVEILLFIVNYFIQKKYIFNKEVNK